MTKSKTTLSQFANPDSRKRRQSAQMSKSADCLPEARPAPRPRARYSSKMPAGALRGNIGLVPPPLDCWNLLLTVDTLFGESETTCFGTFHPGTKHADDVGAPEILCGIWCGQQGLGNRDSSRCRSRSHFDGLRAVTRSPGQGERKAAKEGSKREAEQLPIYTHTYIYICIYIYVYIYVYIYIDMYAHKGV